VCVGGGAVDRGEGPSLCPLFALQFGGLLDGDVLIEQLQHFLLVVEDLHHGVSGLGDLVHHQLAALHVTLGTSAHTSSAAEGRNLWVKTIYMCVYMCIYIAGILNLITNKRDKT